MVIATLATVNSAVIETVRNEGVGAAAVGLHTGVTLAVVDDLAEDEGSDQRLCAVSEVAFLATVGYLGHLVNVLGQ